MEWTIDLHTHTISSGHAYSTLRENIIEAKSKGIRILGVSDHAPKMPGSCQYYYFHNMNVIKPYIDGVRILKGVEANILDFDGNLDMSKHDFRNLDYAIASLHPPCIKYGTIPQNTNAVIKAMENPFIKIIGHPDDSRFPLDYIKIVKAAKDNKVLLEVNRSSLGPSAYRVGAKENVQTMLKICKENGVGIIFGSDAHTCFDVGDFENCERAILEADFPKELVYNNKEEELLELLGLSIH